MSHWRRFSILGFRYCILLAASTSCAAQATVAKPAYAAAVDSSGMLSSLKVGGAELLSEPLRFCPGVKWTATTTRDAAGVNSDLKSDRGSGNAQTRFGDKRVTVRLTHRLGGFQTWEVGFGPDVIGVESLQDDRVTGAEAIQYVERGEIRPMPVTRLSRVQRARLYLRNGATVLFWHDGWGAPFNLDEMGEFIGAVYRRNLLENGKPMAVCFEVETSPSKPFQPAPEFIPYADAPGGLFAKGGPIRFRLKFAQATRARLAVASAWRLLWEARDFENQSVAQGNLLLDGRLLYAGGEAAVELRVRDSGWFSVRFDLAPAAETTPHTLPSEFRTRFAVVGSLPRPMALREGETLSTYAWSALLGLRCVRESHVMRDYFPERGKPNWQSLDAVMSKADSEAKRWGVRWFFQANERPSWCSDEDYERIAFDMVSRYRDRCHVWEVENEPNFRMAPEDYVRKCLVPFARGAKRADPSCQIIGPACVSVPHTVRFVKAIVAADALRYLDGISTHTYVGPGEPWELFGNPLYLRELWKLAGGRPVWQTEQGYTWGHVSKQEQARYVVRQFLNGFGSGIAGDRHFYFYLVHNGFEPWYLVESGSTKGRNDTALPSAVALRVMNEQIGSRSPSGLTEPLLGVYALRFRGDTDVVALWTMDYPISLRTRGRVLAAVDFMGKPLTLRRTADSCEVRASGYPVYLRVPGGSALRIVGQHLGPNLASASLGAAASASSESKDHPASHSIDGRWAIRDPMAGLRERTFWQSAEPFDPSKPQWLQVKFPAPRTISRILLLVPNAAIDATPRDYDVQVSADGQAWQTISSMRGSTDWARMLTFAPILARCVRLVIRSVNDGWHLDGRWMSMVGEDFKRYTDLKVKVLDLMVFGP